MRSLMLSQAYSWTVKIMEKKFARLLQSQLSATRPYLQSHCRSDHHRLMRSLQRIQLWIRQLPMLQPTRSTVAVIGTTGVGKSQLGIELSKALQGEVINADSMQVMSLANLETTRQNHLFGAQGVQRSGYYYQQGDRE
jgi:transcriptional regulator with AAA-type ATPase domain